MRTSIPHSLPYVGQAEKSACARVITRRQLSQADEVASLEKEIAAFAGHRYGAAVSSGTSALYLALKALNISKSHTVVIPSYACTALINAVLFTGAKPVLADVDPLTGAMTPAMAKKTLRKNTGAIIVPHLFGYPADVAGMARLGVPVIEDCAQCIGAKINGRTVGSLSAVSIFSFYATKLIGAGEGGMVASSDRNIIDTVIALREYDNRETYTPAFNFKLSELHAAVARAQVQKLPFMLKKRLMLARHYQKLLGDLPPAVTVAPVPASVKPVYFRFIVQCQSALLRDRIIKKMDAVGIACRKPIFMPLHRYLRQKGFAGTEVMFQHALSLPLYPDLQKTDVELIVRHLAKIAGTGEAHGI